MAAGPEMTIDELAREAGTTVRSLRVYHERGVLPSPLMKGRTGFYGDDHLSRVRTIGRLLDRGIKLNGIRELLEAWDRGDDLGDVLGVPDRDAPVDTDMGAEGDSLTEVPTAQPADLAELTVTAAELADRYRDVPNGFARLVASGVYEPVDATTYRVAEGQSVRLMEQFVAWGASSAQSLDEMERIRNDCDRLARRFVDAFERTVSQSADRSRQSLEGIAELEDHSIAAPAMAGHVASALVGRFVAAYLASSDEHPSPYPR
ncbi:MerR family transcriptional regulator [Nocardia brasiliensis]|uniref:MerR family transcriptional regulator n=1 Tax=Nocardia brasiliensis TaxID=37326 RepID=UPI003D789C78